LDGVIIEKQNIAEMMTYDRNASGYPCIVVGQTTSLFVTLVLLDGGGI
jgi:hypothetical protein